jgi:serine/threonine-protein kinase RIM15
MEKQGSSRLAVPPASDVSVDGKKLLPKPAAVAQMRAAAAAEAASQKNKMARTLSEDIREQREDLKEAAEYTESVVVDLSLDGVVRWLSPSWKDVVGTEPESVIDKPIAQILISEKDIFEKALEAIRKDDARSQIVRFTVAMGPSSTVHKKHARKNAGKDQASESASDEDLTIDLEGQGIMVYDRTTGKESHVSLVHRLLTCR